MVVAIHSLLTVAAAARADTEPAWQTGLKFLSFGVTLITVVSAAVAFAARQLRRRMIWQLIGTGDKVAIYLPGREIGRPSLGVASEDFYAAHDIATFLQRRGFECDFRHIGPDRHLLIEPGPAVVICGPKSSPTVERLLASDSHFGFVEHDGDWALVDKTTGQELPSPSSDGARGERWDHAYVGVVPRRDGEYPRVLLIAGIHAIGSLGAACFLTRRGNLLRLWWAQLRRPGASALITSEHQLEPPRIGSAQWLRRPQPL